MGQKYPNALVKKMVEEDTDHEYSLLIIENHGKKNPLNGKTMKRKMILQHNDCGHTYEIDIYEFIEGKRRCGKCKGKVLHAHNAEVIEVVKLKTEALTNGEYSFVDEHYINSKTMHLFKHNTCGTVFKKKWDKFKGTPKQTGQRCPECYRKGMESVASRYVRDVLDHLYIDYECEKRFDDCVNPKTNRVLPFDYYLPEIHTLIEVDGEQHERRSFTKYDHEGTVERDKVKNRYAEEKGIELVRIPAKKWSQLPEILYAILSKNLIPTLTLSEVKSIPQSTHPERINKDLKKIHDGEYVLHDLYYFGVDRKHTFQHLPCETTFKHTLYRLKTERYPCPACRKVRQGKDQHDRSNKKLQNRSKGRYRLNDSEIGMDDKGRRLVQCNVCKHSWRVTLGNLMSNNAGCPNCLQLKKDKEWQIKYNLVVAAKKQSRSLNASLNNWLGHNLRKHKKGKLTPSHIEALQKNALL